MDCMQLNALITDYLLSILCTEINDMILKDEEIWENTYLIWKFLKDLYNKDCSISSVKSTTYQESSVKSQEDKNSKNSDSTLEITAKVEILDSQPGSSGFARDVEKCRSDEAACIH